MEERGTLTPALGPRQKRLFELDEVEEASAALATTGRALVAQAHAAPPAQVGETVEALRRRLVQQTERVAALEALEQDWLGARARLQSHLLDAVEDLMEATKPRNRSALDALERILQLLSGS